MNNETKYNIKVNLMEELVNNVSKRRLQHEDYYEVAAYLESVGWNDKRASEVFGVKDIFELAQIVWDAVSKKVSSTAMVPQEKSVFLKVILEIFRNFMKGMIFALPMALSVMSMLTLRFSLWSYENLTIELATSIAIGTILSFLTVGGFTQAIARRGYFYISQNYYNMARKSTFFFIKWGYVIALIISIALFTLNIFISIFSTQMISIIVLYYFFLTTIWLSVTVMYILDKEIVFTGLLLVGIGIVAILFLLLKMNIIISQIIALVIIAFVGLLLIVFYFTIEERKLEKGLSPSMPRLSITLYSVSPYFIYGFLYFLFLYTDRIIAWSTNDAGFMPYLIWFRGPYELGLDFSLLALIFPMGINEVFVSRLMRGIEKHQQSYLSTQSFLMNKRYKSLYLKMLIALFITSLLSSVFIFITTMYIDQNYSNLLRFTVFGNSVTYFVFVCSLIAYTFLSVGLMNAISLFSLSQPEMVNKAIGIAVLLNIFIGFISSRWANVFYNSQTGYSFAIIGLVIGSVVFTTLTTKNIVKVLSNLDYYLYAAS